MNELIKRIYDKTLEDIMEDRFSRYAKATKNTGSYARPPINQRVGVTGARISPAKHAKPLCRTALGRGAS